MLNFKEYSNLLKRFGLKKVFSNGNSKLVKDAIWSFGIPAYKSTTGMTTCPFAGECKNYCYAKKGNYVFNNVKQRQEKLLLLTQHPEEFKSLSVMDIVVNGISCVRIHDSGDFYSKAYFSNWIDITTMCPDVLFYAYTKSHLIVDELRDRIPTNLVIIKSCQSKYDQIDYEVDRHAVVFDSVRDLLISGYELASVTDTVAFQSKNHKIGLLYDFKTRMLGYAKEYAEFYDLDHKEVFNTWVILSGSRKKLLV